MRSRTGQHGSGGDSGFTLIELLVAVVIIGVITVPLADVVIGFLRNSDATTERLLRSNDVQIASAYWAQDVASIGQRDAQGVLQPSIQLPATTPDPNCKLTGTIATFSWDDFANPNDPATVVKVAYTVIFDPQTGQCELHRVRSTFPATDVVLAHYLDPATPPKVTCSTPCTETPTVNEKVTLDLTLTDPGSPGGVWDVPLIGQRRGSS
jgi:prepilin-type N-terminal cleavage/methylation domain-containing protein